MDAFTNSRIVAAYRERTPQSAERAREAATVLPSGIVHDARFMRPYQLYIDRAEGARKWDVDGHGYIDYYGGHGALLLGHQHPKVVEAGAAWLRKGTHFAGGSEIEVEWARRVHEMIPSAERVRFTSSGTEATHLAMRLARASTGRRRIIRFRSHFHGWHDHAAFGVSNHLDGSPSAGVLPEVAAGIVLVDPNDVATVRRLVAERGIAAVIVEPTGANSGKVPTPPAVLEELREITGSADTLLIFDEVVTGFRLSPGGAQALFGIKPDITTLAKILAGGMPGGAVAARKDILDWLDFDAAEASGRERIVHQGTHNANPVCAAMGVATLDIIRGSDACERANALGARLRAGMNEVLEEEGVPWAVYGEHSFFHFFTNPSGHAIRPTRFDAGKVPADWLKTDKREAMLNKLRIAMLLNGVDLKGWRGGILSAAHTDSDLDETLGAWRAALRLLKDEGEIGTEGRA
jgi:glutamate-1-semialdehyde 2,1-aminomutase